MRTCMLLLNDKVQGWIIVSVGQKYKDVIFFGKQTGNVEPIVACPAQCVHAMQLLSKIGGVQALHAQLQEHHHNAVSFLCHAAPLLAW